MKPGLTRVEDVCRLTPDSEISSHNLAMLCLYPPDSKWSELKDEGKVC